MNQKQLEQEENEYIANQERDFSKNSDFDMLDEVEF